MFHITSWKINRIIKKVKSMQTNRVHNQPGDELLKREILYYFELASLYKKLIGHKKAPYAEIMIVESYKAAANLDDSSAHFQVGQILIDEAKFRYNLNSEGVFNSEENLKRCNQLFQEAHAHLSAAEKLGHIAAKRLRGLSLINGWGLDIDKNAGFELIVESIDQEGSWDKVPQIFAAIGLNKPEFFAAIMQRKKET
jgi:hypothetical protein